MKKNEKKNEKKKNENKNEKNNNNKKKKKRRRRSFPLSLYQVVTFVLHLVQQQGLMTREIIC